MTDGNAPEPEALAIKNGQEWKQTSLVQETVPEAAFYPPDWYQQERGAEFIYRKNTILARAWHEADVRAALPRLVDGIRLFPRREGGWVDPETREPGNNDEVTGSLVRISWDAARDDAPLEAVERLHDAFGAGAATLEHLLYVSGHACAAYEPEVVPGNTDPVPRVQTGHDAKDPLCGRGAGVKIHVMDNGLWPGAATDHWWMAGVTGDADASDPADLGQDSGHGTFTSGCVRVTAPESTVRVHNAAVALPAAPPGPVGAQWEKALADQVRARLAAEVPDLLVLNFAAPTQSGGPMLAFNALYDDVIRHLAKLKILCPAGNDGQSLGLWPASYPWVGSVGALDKTLARRASWTNFGPTVDLYAPGDRLVNAFAKGTYRTKWTPPQQVEVRHFDGMALWGGTSFSVAIAAGLVGARMSATGQRSQDAYDDLLAVANNHRVVDGSPALVPGDACRT
jgi:hypothetical protein